MKVSTLTILPALALALSVQGVVAQETETEQAETVSAYEAEASIIEITAGREDLTIFQEAVEIAGLSETLAGEGPFTIFIPSNAAFEALPEGQLQWLVENPEELKSVLLGHVVGGSVNPAEVESIETLSGETVEIHAMDQDIMVGAASVDGEVLPAANGQLYVINAVLVAAPESN
ncbi:MAG: fasciclin domain-containing protein [Longimicrobiales bacterium]